MVRVLYRGGRVRSEGSVRSEGPARSEEPGRALTCLATEDGRIAMVGGDDEAAAYAGADEVVELDGALVLPAFVDAHVHTVQAGFRLTRLDLHGSPSRADALDRLSSYAAARDDDVLIGQGWDESLWSDRRAPTAEELERAAPGRRVFLTRIDGHSAVVSAALARATPGLRGLDGWTADGRVERDAHHAVRDLLGDLVGPDQRLAAARAAARRMAACGIVGFHENAAPHIGPAYEIDLVREAASEVGLRPTVYWGQLATEDDEAVATARRYGALGLAGDLNADGALGSRTAALLSDYEDRPGHRGHAYLGVDQVAHHVEACTRARLQAGFHCIGEAALETVAEGFERAAERLGVEAVVGARHRLEHVEMPSARVVAVLGRLGVTASVQPVFDALWGGPAQMYADRVGERWRSMNPFRALGEVTGLAFGSDSPVTALGPWEAVRAAVHAHEPTQRLDSDAAFVAHTRGGWHAARDDGSGALLPGRRADLALWRVTGDVDAGGLPDLHPDQALPTLVRTVAAGRTIHDEEAA